MSKHWKLLFSVCTLALITACSEGEYNDLSCDSATYVPNCLDRVHIMQCRNDTLVVVSCSSLDYCGESPDGGDACLPIYPNYDPAATPSNPTPPNPNYLCTPNDVRCSGDYIQTCNGYAWVNAETPCEHGCLNGICQTDDSPLPPPDKPDLEIAECSDDTDCESEFSCNAGSCIPTAMLNAKADDPCEPEWYEKTVYEICTDDGKMRYCGADLMGNVFIVEEACQSGCTKVYAEQGTILKDLSFYTAVCNADGCESENQEIMRCVDLAADWSAISRNICLPSTNGGYAPVDMSMWSDEDVTDCLNKCNEDRTDCDAYGYPAQSCEGNPTRCDENNVLWYCQDSLFGIAQGVMECSNSNSICDEVDGEFGCWEPCEEIGSENMVCENNADEQEHTLWKGECMDAGNGRKYYFYDSEDCFNLCDEENLECVVLEPGANCDENDFKPECIGNSTTRCNDGVVELDEDCTDYGNDYICGTAYLESGCLQTCSREGDEKNQCIADEFGEAFKYQLVCDYDDLGNRVWLVEDEDFCSSNQCENETSCKKLVPNEGDACTAGFEESCSGDIVVYCDENEVAAIDCVQEEAKCGLTTYNGAPLANCLTESQKCTNLGEIISECFSIFIFNLSTTYECMDTDIGRYYVPIDQQICDGQCNADGTECE